jgi:Fic family protein
MEPARIEEMTAELPDLAAELTAQAGQLGGKLAPRTLADMADMVRLMNSYYSNRIEGNNTRPRDIELALAGTFDEDPAKRAMQQQNAAHIRLQAHIDQMAAAGILPDPSSESFIRFLHREFYNGVEPSALHVRDNVFVVPGEWRTHDVEVGLHVPPPFATIPAFMAHFHQRFRLDRMKGRTERILGMASAHHRFAWIHPFQDGNGRVSRLLSHAMAHHAGIGAGGLWSVSRGMARGLQGGSEGREEYTAKMAAADRLRQGDRDGRGNLSMAALLSFAKWFLTVCLDQVQFMASLYEIDRLEHRLFQLAVDRDVSDDAIPLIRALLRLGEVSRGTIPLIMGKPERTAQRVTKHMIDVGMIGSDTPRGTLSLRFPAGHSETLFPRLFDISV